MRIPDPAFHFDADPGPTFLSNPESNPTFQYEANPDTTHHLFPDLDPPMLQNDPLFNLMPIRIQILFFTFLQIRVQLSTVMRIRIQLPKMMRIHAHPDPQQWGFGSRFGFRWI